MYSLPLFGEIQTFECYLNSDLLGKEKIELSFNTETGKGLLVREIYQFDNSIGEFDIEHYKKTANAIHLIATIPDTAMLITITDFGEISYTQHDISRSIDPITKEFDLGSLPTISSFNSSGRCK